MSDLASDTLIDGRYRVLSRLGAGGMADVYLAHDEQLGRRVALKLLHRRFAADPGFVERFRREAQAAASLQHPNVVQVYDRGSFDDTYYIAMEYLDGRSLKQLIREEAPLGPLRAIDITLQILKAARFAHRRGVIHRDLKPHNVIVDDQDQAKVTDFGIARAGASDMTETGSIMGTAQYLSPEQAQGHSVGQASDLYSVGVVLYEMLTARVPFDAESAVTIALRHVSEAPVPPREINPQVPQPLEQAVLWALNKNPRDRPQDAEEFIRVLEQVREAIVTGVPTGGTAKMAAVSAVPAALAAASGAALPPVVAPAALAATELAPAPRVQQEVVTYEEPPPPASGRSPWLWLALLLLALLIAGGGIAAYLLTRPATTVVPKVVGDTVGVAETVVQNSGLKPYVVNLPSQRPAGQIIGQNPLGGARADRGSTVTLTASSGPRSVSVPTVVELPAKQAERRLRRAGLKVRVVGQSSNTVPKGDASGTSPGAGTSVPAGTGVTLYVSSGKAPVAVPNVTGDSLAAAKAALVAFKVAVAKRVQAGTRPNTVISQSPSGGTALPGSTVRLVVAEAPPTQAIPNVVGDTAKAAERALRQAGFSVVQSTQTVQQQRQGGKVLSENPKPGSRHRKDTTVTIVVGHYKQPSQTTTTPTDTTTTPTNTNTTPTTTTG